MDLAALKKLPDFPALEQLGSALWDDGQARGAAVLVGAGFSRNAEATGRDVRRLPLWPDLQRAMALKLYGSRAEEAPTDPLRLAEEFRTYSGEAALTDFLREQIPDVSWRPGRLHIDLMALPWADVLTTNYDTLLERASKRHKVVRDAADLASARRPRVVKLHGSIDGNARLIITEEDYRTYPSRFAAFVNTARQTFLENELCLIGFSGDDPNFLQWSGWVRDHLGDNARRIYLVGPLALGPAKRRLLESRNVAPIDLSPLTDKLPRDEAEAKACELFIAYLASRKPPRAMEWEPAQRNGYGFVPPDRIKAKERLAEPTTATAMLDQLDLLWKADRDGCPDWLVMPGEKRETLAFCTLHAPFGYVEASEHLAPEIRISLLGNAAWRASAALQPLPESVETALTSLVESADEQDRTRRAEFARFLLREARVRRDANRFKKFETLLEGLSTPGSDERAELEAQRLLWARDGLDLATVSAGISMLDGPDPAWGLLRAALHCECGEMDSAKNALEVVRSDLADRQHHAPRSVWVASRCAWADTLAGAMHLAETWHRRRGDPDGTNKTSYDPPEEIDRLRRQIRNARLTRIEEPEGYQAGFGPGAYQNHDLTIRLTSVAPGQEADTVFRFADAAHMPLGIGNVDLLDRVARDALDSEPLPTILWYLRLLRTAPGFSSPALKKHFGRIAIASLKPDIAEALTEHAFASAKFWRTRAMRDDKGRMTAVERLRLFLEVLSRLVVRATPEKAMETFAFGYEIAAENSLRHPWLFKQIENVLNYSVDSIPTESQDALALQCLEFPLHGSGISTPFRWPEPITHLMSRGIRPIRSGKDARWRASVSKALDALSRNGAERSQAINRLAYLEIHSSLEDDERKSFGAALWSLVEPEKCLPTDVDLYPHALAALPGDADHDPLQIVRAHLYSAPLVREGLEIRLHSIALAAASEGLIRPLLPTREQAIGLLKTLAGLIETIPDDTNPFGINARRNILSVSGRATAQAFLPVLELGDLDESMFNFIRSLLKLGNSNGAVAGLHEVARLAPSLQEESISDLRRAIMRGDLVAVEASASSIVRWLELSTTGRSGPLPSSLIDAVLDVLETGLRTGLQPRLWCARKLLENRLLTSLQKEALALIVCDLWQLLAYPNLPQQGPEVVGATLARAECVRLATELEQNGYDCGEWTQGCRDDPLPEVRFATVR